MNNENFSLEEIIDLLNLLTTPLKEEIYKTADSIRQSIMGDEVYIRGIIEFSNICKKNCNYCGIRAANKNLQRYRLKESEILESCALLEKNDFSTVVLQSGEDMYYTKERLGELLKKIKQNFKLAITVSAGERDIETYKYWRDCGMDRYLIRFETSNRAVFKNLHPDDDFDYRIDCIKNLKKIGVQTGSGFMIGLPNTTLADIANDILFCRALDCDMIGIGPFIPHSDTPLVDYKKNDIFNIDFYTGVLSILRIVNPDAHIPATTAFDAITIDGRQLCLKRGANVFMPNVTPAKYRANYLLYPNKPCVDESAGDCLNCVRRRITAIGRKIGIGFGNSKKNIRVQTSAQNLPE